MDTENDGFANLKTSVARLVNDLDELADYVEKAKRVAESARVHVLLSEKEAAQILSLTRKELAQRRFYGKKPTFFKIGKHVRYNPSYGLGRK